MLSESKAFDVEGPSADRGQLVVAEEVDHQPSPLGDRLRCLRNRAGLSRGKLAKRAGLSEATIKLIERGRPPTQRSLLALSSVPGFESIHASTQVQNVLACGPLVGAAERLWRIVVELAEALPSHAFRLDVQLDCSGLAVEEPAFSLAVAAMMLHAVPSGRTLVVTLSAVAPEHPHYQRGASPQLIVHITVPEAQGASRSSHLCGVALDACRRAGGVGSSEVSYNLWLIWPTTRSAPPSTTEFRPRAVLAA